MMYAFRQDVRVALRSYLRTPLSTCIALASIALTVGATAVVFAAIKAVLLNPLPYTNPEQLVLLRRDYPRMQQQSQGDWVFWNDTQEIIRRTRTLGAVGVYRNAIFNLSGDPSSTPEALYGLKVTADLFPALGVSPMLGRNIRPEEDRPGEPEEMILSYGLWVRRFHSDRDVVGRTVVVNGHPCAIIGVMPPDFNFPLRRSAAHTPSPYVEFWAPLSNTPGARNGGMGAVARLRPGYSLEEARRDLASIGDALQREFPATNRDVVLRMNLLRDRTVGIARNGLWMLMSAAVLFLLIGCSNVANLLLARGLNRRREIAVRLAMGATRLRILRQLITEACVLAVFGGFGGYLVSAAAWKVLPSVSPVSIPRLAAARADSSILLFSMAVAILNGMIFGLVPALHLTRARVIAPQGYSTRTAASGRTGRLTSGLVMAEVALSVVLVILGGQLLGSFASLMTTDPGFHPDHLLASVILPTPERYPDAGARARFYQRILDSVRELPGVENAGTVDALPFSGENDGGAVTGSDASGQLTAEIDVVGGEYLQALGVKLLEGRFFHGQEDGAIVSSSVAKRLWPGKNPIGQRICIDCTPETPDNWKQVIGVTADAVHAALDGPAACSVYLAANAMRRAQFLVVRTEWPAGEMAGAIRRAVAALDPNQPVFLTATMRELIADSVADRRFIMGLLAVTALLALIMSAAGIYGVVAYTTARRTQEIGIRMAIGATPGKVVSMIFRQGFGAVAMGLIVGLALAWISLHALHGVLTGLDTGSGRAVWLSAALVTLAAGIACWIPARRATLIDPGSALREE